MITQTSHSYDDIMLMLYDETEIHKYDETHEQNSVIWYVKIYDGVIQKYQTTIT